MPWEREQSGRLSQASDLQQTRCRLPGLGSYVSMIRTYRPAGSHKPKALVADSRPSIGVLRWIRIKDAHYSFNADMS